MYNSEYTIVRALDSIKNQTCDCDYEIVIINDGSTDKSQEIVENYITKHPKLDINLINQLNQGVSTTRNIGVKKVNMILLLF